MAVVRRSPWRIAAPLATVLVLAVLWCVYWLVASTAVKTGYAHGLRRLSSRGIAVTCAETRWGGFPFRVEQDCRSPKVMITRSTRPVVVSAADALFVIQIYDPRHAIALLDGPTKLSGTVPGQIQHGRALASLNVALDRTWQASVEVPDVVVDPIVRAERVMVHARDKGGGMVGLAASAA